VTDSEFDPKERALEKQASRDADEQAFRGGRVGREQLWAQNSAVPASVARVPIDFSRVGSVRGLNRKLP
jgi:hypothetical protein